MLTNKKSDYIFDFIDPNENGLLEQRLLHICIEKLMADGIATNENMPYDQHYIADMVAD